MINEPNNRMDYDSYGNQWIGESHDPFGYCGEYLDSKSGLIYLRNRYYDSSTGRFITEDPAKDGLNWYIYCGGNPVMFVDPWGLAGVPDGGVEFLNDLIDMLMNLINNKVDYNNGDEIYSKKLAAEEREKLKKDLPKINDFSKNIGGLFEDVVISGDGTLQQVSSVLALIVELRYEIINGNYFEGDEVIPEDKIYDKYNYYVNTGDIFLAGDMKWEVVGKIIQLYPSVPNQNTFCGNTKWGYWVRVIYYDLYQQGNGDLYNYEVEDWWEPYYV